MIHPLPTNAQITDGDHVRIKYVLISYGEGGEQSVEVSFQYGTTDTDGNFVPHPLERGDRQVTFSDMADFKADSFTAKKPETRGHPLEQNRSAVIDWIDTKGKWPTHKEE